MDMRASVFSCMVAAALLLSCLSVGVLAQHNGLQWGTWSGTTVSKFSGVLKIPRVPSFSGTYYVWPGLQPSSGGVLQNVCDGRSGSWWIGSGWYGTPSLAWGAGWSTTPGTLVSFNNQLTTASTGTWTSTLSQSGSADAVSTFALPGISLWAIIIDVELYSVTWDFGPVVYPSLFIQSTATDKGWCLLAPNVMGSVGYHWDSIVAATDSAGSTCTITNLVTWNPSASPADLLTSLPSAAYSLRLLSQSYKGAPIRVRRSSDNTESDIAFTSAGILDTAALLTFVGTGSGYVSKWYDQSGRANHAVQTTLTQQPLIVSAGVVTTVNSHPTVLFQSSRSTYLSLTKFPFASATTAAAYFVNSLTTYQSWQRYFDFGNSTTAYIFASPSSTTSFRETVSGSANEQGVTGTLVSSSAIKHINLAQFHHLGVGGYMTSVVNSTTTTSASTVTLAPSALNGATANYIGRSQFSADPYLDGSVSEIYFFDSDPTVSSSTPQNTAFVNNIHSFYAF